MTTKFLAFLTLIVTYILIVFGGYVASSESGMGCGPDWPLCNGLVIPVLQGATLIEFTHRVIGAVLVVLSIILFIKIVKEGSELSIRTAAKWMIGLLFVQVLLGAVVVVLDLPAIVVTIHLLIAFTYFAILIYIWKGSTIKNRRIKDNVDKLYTGEQRRISKQLTFIIGLLIITIGLGAYIKHQDYGIACDWLDCRESILPYTSEQLLQTLHRVFAVVSAVYIVYLTITSIRKNWELAIQKRLIVALSIVIIQLALGILAILSNIAVSWAVLHLAAATALFAVIIEAKCHLGIFKTPTKIGDLVQKTKPPYTH